MKIGACLLLCVIPAFAQRTVAPTAEPVGRARGEDHGNYNLVQNYELGVRFHGVNGDQGKYRSDVNFGNGLRLLLSRFSLNSKDGRGRLLDELTVWTQGLGGDPYQSAGLRAQLNRWWRYGLMLRSNDYFNPALPVSSGQHQIDTSRRWQDHDLAILPQSRIKFLLGFSRNVQRGPALSTTNMFDTRDDEYPLLAVVNRKQLEYRAGNEFEILGAKVHWLRTWERYEELTPLRIDAIQRGNNPSDQSFLFDLSRREPYRGTTPGWRVSLMKDGHSKWGLNGRFTSSSGRRRFTFEESALGADRLGAARGRQIIASGDARRPVNTASLTATFHPTSKLTFTNHGGFHGARMEGDATYAEFSNALLLFDRVDFQYLNLRTVTNMTVAGYDLTRRVHISGRYEYARRFFRSIEQQRFGALTLRIEAVQENRLHAGTAAIRLYPANGLTIILDAELGRQDRPFYPTADKDYHALGARARYRRRNLTLTAVAHNNYNFNGDGLATHSARTHNLSVDASWRSSRGITLEAGYAKLRSHTASGLAYFASGSFITGAQSLWMSNLHAGHLAASLAFGPRVDLSLGYSRTQDVGGRLPAAPPPASAFAPPRQLPMLFESSFGRLSVRLHDKLRWNFGYQYYRYAEDQLRVQNYFAHTGFTSLLWTF